MKLAAFEVKGRVSYGMVIGDGIIDAGTRMGEQFPDIQAIIANGSMAMLAALSREAKPDYRINNVKLRKPIEHPQKILCVGVNYVDRNAEYKDGSEPPKYPSLFVRFPGSLVAHQESLVRPPESEQLDYEGEIALVIGSRGRRIAEDDAMAHVAGYTLANEGTVRDWVRHGKFNVTPGKNFEGSGSLGPWIVTPDEIPPGPLRLITRVNGEVRQDDDTSRMVFPIPFLISYISKFCTLEPGDIIMTGTPTGSGARLNPPRYLEPGDVVEVEVPGLGILRNKVIDEVA